MGTNPNEISTHSGKEGVGGLSFGGRKASFGVLWSRRIGGMCGFPRWGKSVADGYYAMRYGTALRTNKGENS